MSTAPTRRSRPADTLPETFFHALPKVELHCHLLGTVQRATLTDWVARERAPISEAEIATFYTRGDKPVGVLRVLRALETQLMRHPDDLSRLMREHLTAAHAHKVRHAEVFWNPTGSARDSGIAYADGVTAIVEAMSDAERELGITSRLIPAIDREASPRDALEMVQWVVAEQQRKHRAEVAGIGIDYRENERPPELFTDAYALARSHGLKTTAHAGEFGMPWTNVQTCIEQLQVDRIDHGYTVVDAPTHFVQRCAERCAEAGLVFTVVPTNSYYLRTLTPERWALDHPIRHMPDLGLAVHPNTDDPTLHLVTPSQAWQKMHVDFGFDAAALRQFMHHGMAAAWVDEAMRQRWRGEFDSRFDDALSGVKRVDGPHAH